MAAGEVAADRAEVGDRDRLPGGGVEHDPECTGPDSCIEPQVIQETAARMGIPLTTPRRVVARQLTQGTMDRLGDVILVEPPLDRQCLPGGWPQAGRLL